ncbi:MAG: efflux RND transporter permease subunit [Rhizobiales bacterium]|nr:efflux RND transporter permease subunit [Hyphomicrobiales bacterium]MBI3674727.1 efflux RND transporter permease subunit [Hyphomicrobiales bacterium]
MNISEFCIRRPVATILMSLAVLLGGVFAYLELPVAALPRAEFPVINVSASLPGASPETMASSVATPLIKQFSTIAGIDSISTSNSLGSTSIAIQFVLDRNIDAAAQDVQAAIARAQRALPADMTSPPSYRKVNPADAPILLLALKSDTVPLTDLDAFAGQVISPTLSTLDGVAQVLIFGSQQHAVRIEIDPSALAMRGISSGQLQSAIAAVNSNTPLGTLQSARQQLTIVADTQLDRAADFAKLVIAQRNGNPVRLGDVTRVIDSVANVRNNSWYDGTRAIILAIQRQPDANTVAVVDRVKAMLPQFRQQLPAAASLELLNDRSASVRAAVADVETTLGLTIVLVTLVIFLFVRRLWATLIPTVAVPVSLIGTLGVMYLLGFSIDNVSLMGLTLSVGLVVDDAIVMLENIVRHMEEDGTSAFEAALKGSREIGFTILSISLSLVAVFIPVLLMGGVIGRIFNEFAVVVTVSILISMFVSLTLTPMMASRILSEADEAGHNPHLLGRILEGGFNLLLRGYAGLLGLCLRHRFVILLVFLASIYATVHLFQTIPKGFFPQEDIGQLQVTTQARQDISFDAMKALQKQAEAVFRRSPFVAHVASNVGGGNDGAMNGGRLFVELKPKTRRPPMSVVISTLRKELSQIPGITAFMTPTQNLSVGAHSSASQYQLVVQGLDQTSMNGFAQRLADAMSADPGHFLDVTTDLQNSALQARIVIDRGKAAALGIGNDVLRSTLYGGFGSQQVATIYTAADSYEVIMELDPRIDWTPARLAATDVATTSGTLVPLGAFARVDTAAGQLTVNQLGQLPAVTVSYNLPDGVSLGDSIAAIDKIKTDLGVPPGISTGFAGTAKTFQDSLANQGLLILGAILTIYIVLGILYESFIHPLTILSGLPAAAAGALATLSLFGYDLSLIAVIGLLMLIGIVKKNAIMMIDVALTLQRSGLSPLEAINRACLLRFRPIMMTTLAALMATLPIALGAGASAELRQPLGVAVVGGLVVSQTLTLFVTPVLYLYMERLAGLFRRPTKAGRSFPRPAP